MSEEDFADGDVKAARKAPAKKAAKAEEAAAAETVVEVESEVIEAPAADAADEA